MPEQRSSDHSAARAVGPLPLMGFGHGPGRRPMPTERPRDMGGTLRRIWGYLCRQGAGLAAVCLLTAAGSGLALVGPYLIGKSIDRYVIPHDYRGLLGACLELLAVYACGSLLSWVQQYVTIGVAQRTVQAMRQDLFAQFQALPLRFFDARTHGELMSRVTNDITNVSNTLNQGVTQWIGGVFTLVGTLAVMLWLSPPMTLVAMVSAPLVLLVGRAITSRTRRYFAEQQKTLGEVNGYIEETISGQRVIQAFGREPRALEEFRALNARLRQVGIRAQVGSGSMGPIMNMLGNLNFAIVATAGGWLAFTHVVTIGIIVSFLTYSRQFSQPINQLANQYNMIQAAVAGAERVFEVLEAGSEYDERSEAPVADGLRGEVAFERVSFGYREGVDVLRDVHLVAGPGDTIALVGPTGAGKTTIVNLLTRFYDVTGGAIRVDGVDIRTLEKNSLRRRLGIVLQDAYLFSDTIRENIRYGRLDASDAEVEAAAAVANADGFIGKLPQGYDTPLSAEGGNLSQGQRQLITIARAVLADPAILVLDEATSSVDTRTEMHIQQAMQALMRGRTSFVVAHRLSTIRHADLILVIQGGRIVERGTHSDLLAQRGFYYELFMSQFSRAG